MTPSSGNPFVYDDPIRDPNKFAGRDKELSTIQYDMDLSLSDNPQYKKIGITGQEGAGKSSITYKIEQIAEEKNILPVRITLDEGDAENSAVLFRQIYDGITDSIGGSVRENFINLIGGITNHVDSIDLQLIRIHFSSDNNAEQEVLDSIVRDDLKGLFDQSEAPAIAIIIDNAQHLTENRVILQKFKNIFTEIDGYILVLSGTEDTFSEITSAFSPLARTFNKIQIGPFDSYEDTKKCLRTPLDNPEKNLLSDETIAEIHRITGGRPYEINLLAHKMYGRYDRGETDSLELTSEVIDEVIAQLRVWKQSNNNAFIELIDKLSDQEVRVLTNSIEFPNVSKEWLVQYSLLRDLKTSNTGKPEANRDEIIKTIDKLIDLGLLSDVEDVEFSGDLYSLAYLKYHAISNNIVEDLGIFLSVDNKLEKFQITDLLIANIHYKLVDGILLENIPESHSHFIPDPTDDTYEHGLRSVISKSKSLDISSNLDRGIISDQTVTITDSEDYFQNIEPPTDDSDSYSEEDTFSFRCNITWMDSGFRAIIHFDGDNKTIVENRAKSLQDILGSMGYEIIFKDERDFVKEGVELASNKEFSSAIECFEQAIDYNSKYVFAWFQKSKVHLHNDELQQALDSINRCLELRGDWIQAYLLKAEIFGLLEDNNGLIRVVDKVSSLNPENAELMAQIAHKLSKNGEFELAKYYCEQALDVEPDNLHAMVHLFEAETSIEGLSESKWILDKIIDSGEDQWIVSAISVSSHNLLKAYQDEGDEKYIEDAEHILNTLPIENDVISDNAGRATLFYNRSCIKSILGKTQPALQLLDRAVELNPDYAIDAKNDEDFTELHDLEEFDRIVNRD